MVIGKGNMQNTLKFGKKYVKTDDVDDYAT